MHWPCAKTPDGKPLRIDESPTIVKTWKLMEKLVGPKCRANGVSNFTQKTFDTMLTEVSIVPVVNQVELHPFDPNLRLVPCCLEKGIRVVSWRTMGGGADIHREEEIFSYIHCPSGLWRSMAARPGAWLSRGQSSVVSVIPKSSSPTGLVDNLKLVELSESTMKKMDGAHKTITRLRFAVYITVNRG